MIRSSVVLPEPEGPSSASSEPAGTSRLTLSSAWKLPNRLLMFLTEMLTTCLRQDSPLPIRSLRVLRSSTTLTTRVTRARSVRTEATAKEPELFDS